MNMPDMFAFSVVNPPCVMGILNVTPDSFYAASRQRTEQAVLRRVEQILAEGGTIIDVGACSTRPGAVMVAEGEERDRLRWALGVIRKHYAGVCLSVDTFRASIARLCVEDYGASIINDVSAGSMDERMFDTVAQLGVPYVLTFCTPLPAEADVEAQALSFFGEHIGRLRSKGFVGDIILDPGFGFGKTVGQNYALLRSLPCLKRWGLPVLVGLSRKSMIYRVLGISQDEALNGTTVLHTVALWQGARILRVHDVRAAVETVKLWNEIGMEK